MGRSNYDRDREARARELDPEAWLPPMSREKDLRRLKAREAANREAIRNSQK